MLRSCAVVLLAAGIVQADSAFMQQVLGLAANAPPEYATDAVLTAASRDPLRKEIYADLFELASRAALPVGRKPYSILQSTGATFRLDRLSLQSRIVRALSGVDPKLARELFLRMTLPAPARPGCSAEYIEDASPYAGALEAVVAATFTAAERARAKHVELYREYLDRVNTPSALPRFKIAAARDQQEAIAYSFAGALDRLNVTDRVFTATINTVNAAVLEGHHLNSGSAAALELAAAWKRYLVRHLTGARCETSVNAPDHRSLLQAIVDTFNGRLSSKDDARAAPIDLASLKADHVENANKPAGGAETERWLADWRSLMFDAGGRALPEAGKDNPVWLDSFNAFVSRIAEAAKLPEEEDSTFFLRKGNAFTLALLAAPSAARPGLTDEFTTFLQNASVRSTDPATWLSIATSPLDRLDGNARRQLVVAYEKSGDPVLSVYALLHANPSGASSGPAI